jgi:ATP-binding cassette subfamily F protein uup
LFDKKLAKEEVWIRQGIKARRTRNEGRVRALESMRRLRSERRERIGQVRMAAQDAERSGQIAVETEKVSYAYGKQPIIRDLTTTIMRGDKVGIIGSNGSGKTTLLRLLLGELEPQKGTIRHGTRLSISYYDQLRAQLDEDQTAYENIGQSKDHVVINGEPRHVIGYLQEFLFEPERARLPVNVLSGGERNRLMLAQLFARPANVLVLDEPTNDLDVDTLDLLEELLLGYEGTLLLVSHDRAFLNNVVTSVLALEGDGRVGEYAGGYEDWLRKRQAQRSSPIAAGRSEKAKGKTSMRTGRQSADGTRRLSYKEQRARDAMRLELDALPHRIEALEGEQHMLAQAMANANFYKQPSEEIVKANARLYALTEEVAAAYARWEKIEQMLLADAQAT